MVIRGDRPVGDVKQTEIKQPDDVEQKKDVEKKPVAKKQAVDVKLDVDLVADSTGRVWFIIQRWKATYSSCRNFAFAAASLATGTRGPEQET